MFKQQISKFHTSAVEMARTTSRKGYRLSPHVKLRKPILPTIDNITVKEDHPLWEFFSNGKFVRTGQEIAYTGRPWSVQELRRKSFEDLHGLWYVCLKERNRLYREEHVYEQVGSMRSNEFDGLSEQIRATMWRIKQVLTERDSSLLRAKAEFKADGEKYLQEFREKYLQEEQVETDEWFDKLERIQYAIFGIPDVLDTNIKVDLTFLKGVKFIGELKFAKFAEAAGRSDLGELRDIAEIYTVFEESATVEGVQNACDKIDEYRLSEITIPGSKEIQVVQGFIDDKIQQAQSEFIEEAENEKIENKSI
ncbi:hypothetical protein CANARDRAFT_195639 [[Candida] arabinofermentans NRRL YB-2248]|uniref:Large ribosomal subunit protein uL29m n=1 Tax=[Candida] arabinofermentans NRRL YB-2248 TaxID=983967 RepID=A0A1E4T4D2_9ASCO|nr:hypothetical protein CANARDRAFT_195639 [[Candida] arabinofermentans NRRL YB-2248]